MDYVQESKARKAQQKVVSKVGKQVHDQLDQRHVAGVLRLRDDGGSPPALRGNKLRNQGICLLEGKPPIALEQLP